MIAVSTVFDNKNVGRRESIYAQHKKKPDCIFHLFSHNQIDKLSC